jgi:pimeloyl-ACP methyl ester carboxylesterase
MKTSSSITYLLSPATTFTFLNRGPLNRGLIPDNEVDDGKRFPSDLTPAWREKPSWMVVAGADRTINPDLERWYANRAHSHTIEVAGASHSVDFSHPKEVADVIESAARAVSK